MASDRQHGAGCVATLAAQLDALTTIVSRAAGAIVSSPPDPARARRKADSSPVTDADEAAEAVILEGLARLAPKLPVVSEEASARQGAPPTGEVFALVDPLDGTREYLAGRGEFTVNLAIVETGVPVLGVVAAPALGLIWRGVVGRGAERLRLDPGAAVAQALERAEIGVRPAPAEGLVAAVSRSHFEEGSAELLARLPVIGRLVCGSSVKFCRIAEGSADVYPRLGPTCEWDIAAGHAVLTAAGGGVFRPNGMPLRYGNAQAQFRVAGFVAWGDPAAGSRFGQGL
jgi:3'(2'), 5'-bisphosphate nucleotidase